MSIIGFQEGWISKNWNPVTHQSFHYMIPKDFSVIKCSRSKVATIIISISVLPPTKQWANIKCSSLFCLGKYWLSGYSFLWLVLCSCIWHWKYADCCGMSCAACVVAHRLWCNCCVAWVLLCVLWCMCCNVWAVLHELYCMCFDALVCCMEFWCMSCGAQRSQPSGVH